MSMDFVRFLPSKIAGQIELVDTASNLPGTTTVEIGACRVALDSGDLYINTPIGWQALAVFGSGVQSVNGDTGPNVVLYTDNISEDGSPVNLWFTTERAQDAVGAALTTTSTIALTYNDAGNTISADIVALSITNALISTSAAIAYSKLNLSGSIVNADIATGAAIAYSKLNLSGSIVNADISSSAAIAYSKLNLANSIVNADISTTAAIAYSKLNLSGAIVNADISTSAAIAYSKLNLNGSIVNADVSASAAIAGTKISPNFGSQNITTTGTTSAASISASGTGGAGFVELPNQSAAPSTPSSAARLFADASNRLSWKGTNGFVRTFDGTANTADRVYTLPNSSGTVGLQPTTQSISGTTSLSDGIADLICYVNTSAARSITLPNPANNTNRKITFKDVTGSAETNNITIVRFGSEKIENLTASKPLTANYGAYTLVSDGVDWWSV